MDITEKDNWEIACSASITLPSIDTILFFSSSFIVRKISSSTHIGGVLFPQIIISCDCTLSPFMIPSDGVIIAYHSSSQRVSLALMTN